MIKDWQAQQDLVGTRVRVILDYDDPEAYIEGVLLNLSIDGEVKTQNEYGEITYSWPALAMEVLT